MAQSTTAQANPAPLGLSAFALTTFVLSSSNAGFLFPQGSGASIVMGLALFYGGVVQLIAGIQEFRAGNTFGATAFCSYGGFWLAFGFILLPTSGILADLTAKGTPSGLIGSALGAFLLGWTIFTGMMFLGTLRSNLALMGVFFFLFLTFLSLTIGALGTPADPLHSTFFQIGGYLGIVTALLAWYTALAGVMASGNNMFQLPVGTRS
jgi:succinate-acetate transporter protein